MQLLPSILKEQRFPPWSRFIIISHNQQTLSACTSSNPALRIAYIFFHDFICHRSSRVIKSQTSESNKTPKRILSSHIITAIWIQFLVPSSHFYLSSLMIYGQGSVFIAKPQKPRHVLKSKVLIGCKTSFFQSFGVRQPTWQNGTNQRHQRSKLYNFCVMFNKCWILSLILIIVENITK